MAEKKADKIREVRVFEFDNMTVTVYLPDLTPEESARRYRIIHDAAAEVLREKYEAEEKRKKEPQGA